MEKLEIEIPVSVGDKVYRTSNKCTIEEGIIEKINVEASSTVDRSCPVCTVSSYMNNLYIGIIVQWKGHRDYDRYKTDDINVKFYTSKKNLIQSLVNKL